MPLPPWNDIRDALLYLLLPTFGAALFVMLLVRLLAGERRAPLAAALGLAAGLFVGNHFRETFSWRIDAERALNTKDLRLILGWSLEGKPPPVELPDDAPPPEEPPPLPPARYWLPWLVGLALMIDVLMRIPGIPSNVGWTARTLVAVLAGRLLTPAYLRVESQWVSWVLTFTILFQWAALSALARIWKDGTVAAATALCCAAGGAVMLYAHSALLTDMGILLAAALAGIAVISWRWHGDTGPALAAAAVYLPGLMLNGQQETFSEVPWRSFLFAALAPLALLPFFLPFMLRQQRWWRWLPALILPLIPATIAVVLAAQAEKLPF